MDNDLIYQYVPFDKAKYMLRNYCLPLGHYSNYNDPFECLPSFADNSAIVDIIREKSQDKQNKLLRNFISYYGKKYDLPNPYMIYVIAGLSRFTFPPIQILPILLALLLKFSAKPISKYLTRRALNKKAVDLLTVFLNRLNSIYTSCFCPENDNMLMWSHYARSHTGAVIGFSKPMIEKQFGNLFDVNYGNDRISFFIPQNEEEVQQLINQIFTTKQDIWSYEKELRILVNTTPMRIRIFQ